MSFFPSAFGHRHVNLAEGRDHVQEYSEALHRRGIRFFSYYCFQDRYLWDRTSQTGARRTPTRRTRGMSIWGPLPQQPV